MKHIYLFLILLSISTIALGQVRINSNFAFQTDPSKDYSLYIPSTYNANTPNKLMLGMHPFNTSRWNAVSWCDTLKAFAETNGLILVCPDGGSDGSITDPIDTAFTSALLDSVRLWYHIDRKNTYIMGFSVGGQATYTYGLSHPDVFGGLMPIGAAITNLNEVTSTLQANSNCRGVYIVHGANDAASSRYTPVRNALINSGAILNSILMSGVGHTIDFPNRNQILTNAFQWLDSVNNVQLVSDAGTAFVSCDGVGITIGGTDPAKGGQCPYTYAWSPALGLSSGSAANPVATPSQTTTYTLKVTDDRGDTAISQVVVIAAPAPTLAVNPLDSVCVGDSVQLSANSNGSINWSPVNGLSCTTCSFPTASPGSTTTYTAIATDANGCQSLPKIVQVKVNSRPTIFTGPDRTICEGDSVSISAFSNSNITWSPVGGLSCTNCSSPKAAPAATTTYTAISTNIKGCTSAPDQVTVTVQALPSISASAASDSICVGDSVRLTASSMSTGPINWQAANSLSCTNCPDPWAFPRVTTSYFATVTDTNGCKSMPAVVNVSMLPQPVVMAGADTSICFGDSIQLRAQGSGRLQWQSSAALSCRDCLYPKSAPRIRTIFTVTTVDGNGCVSEPDSIVVGVNPVPTAFFTFRNQLVFTEFTNRSIGGTSWLWDFGNGDTDTSESLVYTFPKNTFWVCLTATNDLGCKDTHCDSIMGTGAAIDPTLQSNIQIYPNPTTGRLLIKNQDISLKAVEIRVLDMFGREILTEKRQRLDVGQTHELQLGDLPTGIYLVEIRAEERMAVRRVEVR